MSMTQPHPRVTAVHPFQSWFITLGCAVAFLTGSLTRAHAATPRDELLRFVPPSAGFCIILQDLRGHVARMGDSPFVKQLPDSPLGPALTKAKEVQKLFQIAGQFQLLFGMSIEDVRDKVLGDAVIFVYQPGPMDNPDEEQGLLMIRAQSAEPLRQLLDRLNELQRQAGDLKELEERSHRGIKYICRLESRTTTFYHLRGPILLVTSQESFLKSALETEQALGEDMAPPLARRLAEMGVEGALLTVWVNPRGFDAALDHQVARAEEEQTDRPNQLGFLQTFLRVWKAIDGIAIALVVEDDITVSLTLKVKEEELPPGLRNFIAGLGKPSVLWQTVPEDAILATGGRLDLPALLETVEAFLPESTRKDFRKGLQRAVGHPFGLDAAEEVLPAVGPDWIFFLAPPPAESKQWAPQGVFAVRLTEGKGDTAVDRTVFDILNRLVQFGIVAHNLNNPDETIMYRRMKADAQDIRYLESDTFFPTGVQPAITLHEGFLVVGTSPDVVRNYTASLKKLVPAKDDSARLAWISFRALQSYIQSQMDPLAEEIARTHNLTVPEARRRLLAVFAGLHLLDECELRFHTPPGKATLRLSIKPRFSLQN
jgi:hypothetical protein